MEEGSKAALLDLFSSNLCFGLCNAPPRGLHLCLGATAHRRPWCRGLEQLGGYSEPLEGCSGGGGRAAATCHCQSAQRAQQAEWGGAPGRPGWISLQA